MKLECKCGLLLKFAEDPDVRIICQEKGTNIALVLNDNETISIHYCPICGGQELEELASRGGVECSCQILSKWADDPNVPIEYDAAMNEYNLLGRDKSRTMFYYCPICGCRLPESISASLFTEPSEEEKAGFREKTRLAETLEDVVIILGEPNEKHGAITSDPLKKKIYNLREVKRTFMYTSLSDTLVLYAQEYEDGELVIFFTGKRKNDA